MIVEAILKHPDDCQPASTLSTQIFDHNKGSLVIVEAILKHPDDCQPVSTLSTQIFDHNKGS